MTKASQKLRFGDLAVQLGYLSEEDLKNILSKKGLTNQMLGNLCVEYGYIDEEQLGKILAAQYSTRYVELTEIKATPLFEKIDFALMTKYKFVPFAQKKNNVLEIAMANPMDFFKVVDELEMQVDLNIALVVASASQLDLFLKKMDTSRSVLDTVAEDFRLPIVRETEKGEDVLSLEKISADESPIVRIVDSTILDAINKRASDIHIESSEIGVMIRYRIDGMLHQAAEPFDIRHQSPVISRIKVMSELDIAEKRIPQDGRFKLKVRGRYIDFRVSILPTIFGEDAVIRILDQESMSSQSSSFNLNDMQLPDYELVRIRRMIRAPYGMFLMSGPTGSGKTSTLYRSLAEINSKDVKIITIEDPVEYQLKGITQIPVNEKKGLTFATGLRSILRHDPDTILVGEIRDSETAQIALQSALTGHLVFTTVHANSSFEVINRFIHMGIEPYNLMSALNCIVAQRLIRVLCDCRVKVPMTVEELEDAGIDPKSVRRTDFYMAKGCDKCKLTGYAGRKAIIELVELDDVLKEMFIKQEPHSHLKQKALELGTTFLREAALYEVFNGNTTLKEANRMTFIERPKEGAQRRS